MSQTASTQPAPANTPPATNPQGSTTTTATTLTPANTTAVPNNAQPNQAPAQDQNDKKRKIEQMTQEEIFANLGTIGTTMMNNGKVQGVMEQFLSAQSQEDMIKIVLSNPEAFKQAAKTAHTTYADTKKKTEQDLPILLGSMIEIMKKNGKNPDTNQFLQQLATAADHPELSGPMMDVLVTCNTHQLTTIKKLEQDYQKEREKTTGLESELKRYKESPPPQQQQPPPVQRPVNPPPFQETWKPMAQATTNSSTTTTQTTFTTPFKMNKNAEELYTFLSNKALKYNSRADNVGTFLGGKDLGIPSGVDNSTISQSEGTALISGPRPILRSQGTFTFPF